MKAAGTQQAPSENTNQNNQSSQSGSQNDGQNDSYSENQDYQAGGVDKTNPDTGAEDHLALAAAAAAVSALAATVISKKDKIDFPFTI